MTAKNMSANDISNIKKELNPCIKEDFNSILSSLEKMPADSLLDETLEKILDIYPKEIDSQQADYLYKILEAASPDSINARALAVNVAIFYLQRNLFRISVYISMQMNMSELSRYAAKKYITGYEVQSLMEDRRFIKNNCGADIAELAINNSKMKKLAEKYMLKISYE